MEERSRTAGCRATLAGMPLSRALPAVLVLLAGVVLAATARVVLAHSEPRPSLVGEAVPAASPDGALALLRSWDERRAAAWSAGDPRALAALYRPGSRTGAHDVAMLRRWVARGLVVRDLAVQVHHVRVVGRAPGRFVLEVVDRVAGGRAVASDASTDASTDASAGAGVSLPQDGWTAHRVTLVEGPGGEWLVAEISPPRASRRGPSAGPT